MTMNGIAEGFTKDDLDQFESLLLERRRLLMDDVRSLEEAEARDAPETGSRATHLADLGTDRASSDVSLGCRASASTEIQEIDDALERIREGSFGSCEECGKPIARARLEAIPYARFCIPCKTAEER